MPTWLLQGVVEGKVFLIVSKRENISSDIYLEESRAERKENRLDMAKDVCERIEKNSKKRE